MSREIIIVTGSSGFIGRSFVEDLLGLDYHVVGIDIKPSAIKNSKYTHHAADLSDPEALRKIKSFDSRVLCVCHFASSIRVDESMKNPELYYKNGVVATINLLNWCNSLFIKNFIFASTAAVYGNKVTGELTPYGEMTPYNNKGTAGEVSRESSGYLESEAGSPVSVYGRTKLMCEQVIKDYAMAYQLSAYIFRFFNVCGGSESNHDQPIHLLPIIVNNLRLHKDIDIFGTDYQTRDGTCLRDYVHLKDISQGFIKAIDAGFGFIGFKTYNLGSGSGYTVKEIINKLLKVYTELKGDPGVKIKEHPRRRGDFDTLLSNCDKVKAELGWAPKYDLDTMIRDTILAFD